MLYGGAGNDTLVGGSGYTQFYGGAGNNVFIGGSGGNTYFIDLNSSINKIVLPNTNVPGTTNIVAFASGYDNVRPFLGVGSLDIHYGTTGGELIIEGFDPNNAQKNPGIDFFQFTDRTLTYDQLLALGFDLSATGAGQVVNGTSVTDRISGLQGNDTLNGGAGNDTLTGGPGDVLVGGKCDDTYVFRVGDGTETIQDRASQDEGNQIRFGTGITLGGLTFTQDAAAHTLTIQVGGSGSDRLILSNFDPTGVNGSLVVQTLAFADGTTADLASLLAPPPPQMPTLTLAYNGQAQDRVGQGNGARSGDGLLDGTFTLAVAPGSGNRTLTALTLTNDAGGVWDTSDGTAFWTLGVATDPTSPVLQQGSDSVQAPVADGGRLTLFASDYQSQEFLAGRQFTVTATFADGTTASASTNANTIVLGGLGNETFQFARGSGQDTLINETAPGDTDTLQFAAGINPLDVVFARDGNDLQLSLHGSSDGVNVQNWFAGGSHQVDVIRAGDGEQLLNTKVDQLIQAMASFGQQTGLTWDHAIDQRPQDVQTILAASWH